MKKYLTLTIVTYPVLNSNTRGKGVGNHSTLQVVTTADGVHTLSSSYAFKYGVRARMADEGAEVWRHIVVPELASETASYFGYGAEKKRSMLESVPEDICRYDDTILFGFMAAAKEDASAEVVSDAPATKGKGNKPKATTPQKNISRIARGACSITPGLSTTLYQDDVAFAQGHILPKDGKTDLCPFTYERHYTRYVYTVCLDIETLMKRPSAIINFLRALQGIQVGGNQSSNRCEFVPEIILWTQHDSPSAGLHIDLNRVKDFPLGEDLGEKHLAGMREKCKNIGLTFEVAGGPGPSVHETLTRIIPNRLGV